jgi:uncharacterized protein (TIGR00255 family)
MVQIKSMTGFGTAEAENQNWHVKAEIKSLNNKFLDLNIRLPKAFKDKEIEFRQLLMLKAGRGSVSLFINAERKENNQSADSLVVNTSVANGYKIKLEKLASELSLESGNLFNTILTMPDVLKFDETDGVEEDWLLLKNTVEAAFAKFDDFRIQEGNTIRKYFEDCLAAIQLQLKTVEIEEKPRKEAIKDKLFQALADQKEKLEIDHNRFEQELIFYLEKFDIGEEKSRLNNHLGYFNETLAKDANGKKLNFIAQEIGREINTMGSKAKYFPIQQAVVCMKEELEKIKEQLLNIL